MRKVGPILAIGAGILALAGLAFHKREEIMNLFSNHKQFIDRLWKALDAAEDKLILPVGTVQKTILIAQAIHEAGWGAAKASKHGFNYWNLTAGSKWKGPVVEGKDTEYDAQGNVKNISQKFRRYGSDLEGVMDMLRFIGPGSRYALAWEALQAGDAMLYAQRLYEKGFFTQPLHLYQAALRKAIQTVVQTLG